MNTLTIYHNPNCSKSRATLALIEDNNISPEIIYYLETAPDIELLNSLLSKLGIGVRDLLRTSEREYEELGLDDVTLTEQTVLDLMCKHPKLIQRPIVTCGDKAIIGRPPENVLSLLDELDA